MPARHAARNLLLLVAGTLGCAGTIVRPEDLPPRPAALDARGQVTSVLVLSEAPAPMADEMRAIVGARGAVEEIALADGEPLDAACGGAGDRVVLRPSPGRAHFASNAPDRNTLFIYETAIIVGIPVTLVSAIAWPYYAETLVEAELDVLSCADGSRDHHVEAFRLRSQGRGFVRTQTLIDAQREAALRAVTRELMSRIMEEGGRT